MRLQSKIIAFILVAGLLSVGLTISIFNRTIDFTLTEQVSQQATAEAVALAKKVVVGIQNLDESGILRELQTSQKITNARDLVVLDAAGVVVAHTNVTETGKRYHDARTRRMSAAGGPVLEKESGPHPTMIVSAPVWNETVEISSEEMMLIGSAASAGKERMGTVVLAVPLELVLHTRVRMIRHLVSIAAIIGLVGLILAVVLIRNILRPVRLLTAGTAQISNGQYDVQIPVTRGDELGDLTRAFNRMSSVLAQTTISKEFMASVFAHMTEPLMVFGTDGLMRMVNGATLRLLGYEERELIGQPATAVLPLENSGASDGNGLRPVNDLDFNLLAKGGTQIPVVYSCSPLRNSQGTLTGSIVIARDMTERQRLETAMRRSEKMSAVGQLAAGVAHEINNPLGVILGYAQAIVRRIPAADPMEGPLKAIEKEAVRCKNLVQDLLTFSRVSKVEKEPMDLNKAVTAALSLVNAQARIGQVTVEKDLADGLPHILGNINQIQQVIINLATNALDAMNQSGTLRIATELLPAGPLAWVCLKITDTGSGIPDEVVSRMFEPFFTTKPVGKGTGLGLSLVHEIVKKHSGSIDVQSRPGRTEFSVKFPARHAAFMEAVREVL